jgi:sugar-phosphatase
VLEAVIFDMDGVLIDSEPLWQDVEVEIFGALGVPITRERCKETMGFRVNEAVAHWHERYPWDGPSIDEVAGRIVDDLIDAVRTRGGPMPGVDEAVAACSARVDRLAICTSSYYRVIDAVVDACGLGDVFAVVHSAEDEERGKPDPAVYLSTARKLGVAPASCLAIEDSPNGVVSAKQAGMVCVAVPDRGLLAHEGFQWADLVVGSLTDLARLDDDGWRRLNGE